MVDNLNTSQKITRAEANLIVKYLQGLPNQVPQEVDETGLTGHIGNIVVNLSPGCIKTHGSLARYLYGSNMREFDDISEIHTAVEKLSDELHIDMSQSIVNKLEIGRIFVVPRPPIEYISLFWHFPRLTMVYPHPNSTYFQTKKKKLPGGGLGDPTRQIKAYDKLIQGKQCGYEIPDIYQGTPYLLKIEETFWDVANQLRLGKGNVLRMQNLWSPMYWDLMIHRLYKTYHQIKKLNGYTRGKPIAEFTGTDIFYALCAKMFQECGGKQRIDKFLAPFYQNPKALKKDVKSRCNQKIAKTMKYLMGNDDIIAELDEIVKTTLFGLLQNPNF